MVNIKYVAFSVVFFMVLLFSSCSFGGGNTTTTVVVRDTIIIRDTIVIHKEFPKINKKNFEYDDDLGASVGISYYHNDILKMYRKVFEICGDTTIAEEDVTFSVFGQKYSMEYNMLSWISYWYRDGLEACEFSDSKPYKYYSTCELAKMIMNLDLLDVEKQQMVGANFNFVNPLAIQWMRQKILVKPDEKIGGRRFQVLFDRVASRYFKVIILSFYHFISMEDIEREIEDYMKASQSMDGASYLLDKYHYIEPQYYEKGLDGYYLTPAMGIGFWMRRYVDGSFKEFATAYLEVINLYAPDWHEEVKLKFPNCNVGLTMRRFENAEDLTEKLFSTNEFEIEGLN